MAHRRMENVVRAKKRNEIDEVNAINTELTQANTELYQGVVMCYAIIEKCLNLIKTQRGIQSDDIILQQVEDLLKPVVQENAVMK